MSFQKVRKTCAAPAWLQKRTVTYQSKYGMYAKQGKSWTSPEAWDSQDRMWTRYDGMLADQVSSKMQS